MQSAISESEIQVRQDPDNDLAIVRTPSVNSGASSSVLREQAFRTLRELPIGAAVAANPPGVRATCFKVLGNDQRGFQMWLSRDGLTWLPFGQTYATYREMATAFAASYPRPPEVLDPVIAAAYDAPETASFLTTTAETPAGLPDASGASVHS